MAGSRDSNGVGRKLCLCFSSLFFSLGASLSSRDGLLGVYGCVCACAQQSRHQHPPHESHQLVDSGYKSVSFPIVLAEVPGKMLLGSFPHQSLRPGGWHILTGQAGSPGHSRWPPPSHFPLPSRLSASKPWRRPTCGT